MELLTCWHGCFQVTCRPLHKSALSPHFRHQTKHLLNKKISSTCPLFFIDRHTEILFLEALEIFTGLITAKIIKEKCALIIFLNTSVFSQIIFYDVLCLFLNTFDDILGTKVCSNGPGHMTKMATMPIYGKNLKNLLLWNQTADDLETWYASSGFQVLPSLLN